MFLNRVEQIKDWPVSPLLTAKKLNILITFVRGEDTYIPEDASG
jgi:hypothetical protein